jgi:hypothetical protein
MIQLIGWIATAVFSTSYFFEHPVVLRRVQAVAASLWVIYGLSIGALPVVVANLIVAGAAVWSSFRTVRKSQVSGKRGKTSALSAP